jgi:hypothetical protein
MKKLILILALASATIALGAWTYVGEVPVPQKALKHGASLVTHGTLLYALQGNNTTNFFSYDPLATWAVKTNIPYALKPNGKPFKKGVKAGGALTAYGDFVYAFKGGNTNEFWAYNTIDDTWIQQTSIDISTGKKIKTGGALVAAGDYIYALKGGNTKEFWMYDPAGLTWTRKADLTTPDKMVKGGGAMVEYDGAIYAFVGNNTFYFYSYDVDANTWTRMADAKFGADSLKKKIKDGAALTALGDKIYAFKGGNTQSFGCYDPVLNTWATLDTIPRPAPGLTTKKKVKHGGSLTAYDNTIYAFKGNNTKEFWKYTLPAK